MFKYLMLRNIRENIITGLYCSGILGSPTGGVIETVIVGGDGCRSDLTAGLLLPTARSSGRDFDVGNL